MRTPANLLDNNVGVVNTNLINLSSGVNTLSTNIGGVFNNQATSFTTRGILISNTFGCNDYTLNLCNGSAAIYNPNSDNLTLGQKLGVNATIAFDTVESSGFFSRIGVGGTTRGAFWGINGTDYINIGTAGNVAINNNGSVRSNYQLFVNGHTGISTALTVIGTMSTTGNVNCLGRLNASTLGNISTAIIGNNNASTSSVSLDVYGTYRTGLQTFFSSGTLQINGGNWIFANISTAATINLPVLNTTQSGVGYQMHKNSGTGLTITFSTSGAASNGVINYGGNTFSVSSTTRLVSILSLGSGTGWSIVGL